VPKHSHKLKASTSSGNENEPVGRVLAAPGGEIYVDGTPDTTLAPASVSPSGGSQPHENRGPYLTLNYCIALQGIFPSRN
jgi:microcystin-dependent protein